MDEFDEFIDLIDKASDEISSTFVGELEFSGGYSLKGIAKSAMEKIGDPQLVLEIAIIGALKGNFPRDSHEIKLCNGASYDSFMDAMQRNGIFHRGKQGASGQAIGDKLTPVRLAAAFAEPIAATLKKAHSSKPMRKRFKWNKLPPYYEFAGFGTLRLPQKLRDEHLVFSHEFSKAISNGGTLDTNIYDKMASDAVELRRLKIFDEELIPTSRPTENIRDLCDMIDRADPRDVRK
jgi:hypothetical protein